jgi:hypothetical protein
VISICTRNHNHPSNRPNLLNSCSVHALRDLSFSRSLPLPLSALPLWTVLAAREGTGGSRGVRVGGDADNGVRVGAPAGVGSVDETGSVRRYHPPVHVSATSWCSGGAPGVGGAAIQPTTHRSSSGTSGSRPGVRIDVCESEMCSVCVGRRYCAYDHSDSKYLGIGRNGASGDSFELLFLRARQPAGPRKEGRATHSAAVPPEMANTCTVPLSLHTHSSCSSGRNATP